MTNIKINNPEGVTITVDNDGNITINSSGNINITLEEGEKELLQSLDKLEASEGVYYKGKRIK